ncbi:MAG: hypothetical protein CSA47_01530 [Gammaproteobacteria bacterium]|nr:MAG: hypothetical protein CSA47_01530 [Gammaproteobacteria bacterium]
MSKVILKVLSKHYCKNLKIKPPSLNQVAKAKALPTWVSTANTTEQSGWSNLMVNCGFESAF